MRMVKLSFNKDVSLHQGWRSQEVKRKSICEASFRKVKSPTKSSAGILSWEFEKWKASQNDFVELLIFPSPFFWMERMKVSISACSWNSLVPIFLFSLYRKEDHNAPLYSDSAIEPVESAVLWAADTYQCQTTSCSWSGPWQDPPVSWLHSRWGYSVTLHGLVMTTHTINFHCLPCPFRL